MAPNLAHNSPYAGLYQGMLMLKIKGHVIPTHLEFHINCFFSYANNNRICSLAYRHLLMDAHNALFTMRQSPFSGNVRQSTAKRCLRHRQPRPFRPSVTPGQPTCEGGRAGCTPRYLTCTVCFSSIRCRYRSITTTALTLQPVSCCS